MIADDIDAALGQLGSSRSDKFRRNSLLVLRQRFRPSEPPLRVDIGSSRGAISATDMAVITAAVQDAAARIGHLVLHPNTDAHHLVAEMRARAELIPTGQAGNSLFFSFAGLPRTGGELDIEPSVLAEQAVRELIGVLPEDSDGEHNIAALPAARLAIRTAVSELAKAVAKTKDLSISIASTGGGDAQQSTLTREQATRVQEVLSPAKAMEERISVVGVIDGLRRGRRLFYLTPPPDTAGTEYEGVIPPQLVAEVQRSLGRTVQARLIRNTSEAADGTRTRPTYALESFEVLREVLPDLP